MFVSFLYYMELKESSVKDTNNMSAVYAAKTENILNSIFHKTDILAAVVKLQNGQLSENTFNDIARLVYEDDHGIRGIQSMPGAVVTYSYPLKGNEAVMGKNFFEIPERRKDVLLAIDTKSIALSGPYNLLQGGLGVVARNPIFLTDAAGKEYFWGFSAIILDLPKAIEGASLHHLINDGYDYQLYCTNENNERLVIEGNPDLNIEQAVCNEIKVPHHVWTLAIRPGQPWLNEAKAGLVLLFGFLLSLILWQRYSLLVQKETAMQAKDVFFSNISHDMRTPLNAVLGFVRQARKTDVTPELKDEYLSKVELSGNLLLDLINDTLTVSRISSGKLTLHLEPCSTKNIVESIVSPIIIAADQKHIAIDVDISAMPDKIIMADRLNLEKIFLNLLTNAVRYTPEGGHVWFTVVQDAMDATDTPRLSYTITVRDNGIGMSPEYLPHVFEPFSQEKQAGYDSTGTGLGLSIVKQLVTLMGGTVQVESIKGKGTTFTVQLNFVEGVKSESAEHKVSANKNQTLAGKKVLLCEDNSLNREIAVALLNEKGIEAVTAADGQQGVQKFNESEKGEYACILMDIRMPVMDGLEATERIRSLNRADAETIPIIAMTANAFADDVQACLDAGMNGHVSKPISPEQLFKTIQEVI